jgi:hypothetical protein
MDMIRKNDAKAYRMIRKILRNSDSEIIEDKPNRIYWPYITALLALIIGMVLLTGCAFSYTLDEYADAIRKAEGNSNYGILAHYKHTSYRQACKNTVKHQYSRWVKQGKPGAFVSYLGHVYAPIGVSNDPNNLNINWTQNVSWFLEHPKGV